VNGFAKQQLSIGSKQPVHQHKECNNCNEMKPPEGGIQLNHAKWRTAPPAGQVVHQEDQQR